MMTGGAPMTSETLDHDVGKLSSKALPGDFVKWNRLI